MSSPVVAEILARCRTGNVELMLNEVRHALERLVVIGETTTIDLTGIPMSRNEVTDLETALGRGEMRAELELGGPTEVLETGFSGVWLVTHRSAQQMILGRYIEVTPIPEILRAQPSDIRAGLARLQARLSQTIDREEAK